MIRETHKGARTIVMYLLALYVKKENRVQFGVPKSSGGFGRGGCVKEFHGS